MNTPWIIGLLLAIAFFAYFEKRAFDFPSAQNTLSRAIYNLGQSWPLSIWIMGLFAGSLATHFFWHFCPPGSLSTGWLMDNCQIAFEHGHLSASGCILGDGFVHLTLND